MPLVQNFSASQTLGEPGVIVLEDISTGADAAVLSRRVYLRLANGSYLVPEGVETDYIVWPIDEDTLELDVLTMDKAVDITVQWMNAANAAAYTKTTLCLFTQYAKQFLYDLTQGQTGNPVLVDDNQYWEKKGQLFTLIDSAENAVELANDIYGAQQALDRAQTIIDNAEYYFF
jgi:hypothetical protein